MGTDITLDRTQYPTRVKVMESKPCGFMMAVSMWLCSSRRPHSARWSGSFSSNADIMTAGTF